MKVVLQDGMKDCGVCCLLSIIRFYGGDVPKEYLREITNTTREGVSFYNLLSAAKKIGFDVEGMSGELDNIDISRLPCIVHFNIRKNYQHFVVLYKINSSKKNVLIMDPAKGGKTLSFSEFKLLSSNHYLFFRPYKRLPIFRKRNVIVRYVLFLFKNNRKKFFIIIILSLQSFFFQLISSFHFKYLLEYSIKYEIFHNLIIISLFIGILYFLKNISNCLKNILFYKMNSLLNNSLSSVTYKQILLLPYFYFKNRTTGEVLSRYKDLNIITDYLSQFFCSFTTDFFTLFFFFFIMIRTHFFLAISLNIILFLFSIMLLFSLRYKKSAFKKIKNHEDIVHSYMVQGISNVDTIKGSHLEKRFIDKFHLSYQSYQSRIYQYESFSEFEFFLRNLFIDFIYLFIYGMGSYYVIKGILSLGTLVVFQTFIHYYLASFFNVVQLVSLYPTFKISKDRIEELFLLDSEVFVNHYYYLPYQLSGDIIVHDLSYQIGTHSLFNHLNLRIKKGEKILLCGDSGCGKSTLVKMFMRYIDVEYGKISISGIDINHYHLENIRSHITYVTANEFLFSDTLKNNITMYQDYSEDEFEKICSLCYVKDFLPDERGYDMMIEENGFNLSNGERQRVILARSLIRKSNIYIFDEALSQIDIGRERIILQNIFQFLSDKIVIVISHRFHNQELFDRVLKMKNGVVCEKKKL